MIMFILVRNRLRTDKHFMVKDRNYDVRREVEATSGKNKTVSIN